MKTRADQAGVHLRPHFKTHQSHEVGRWFREVGVERITVSSVAMAEYFAADGWKDIVIAFPLNVFEIPAINRLAEHVRLGILVQDLVVATTLSQALSHPVNLWLKIDPGSGRVGVEAHRFDLLDELVPALQNLPHLNWQGFLAHAGHAYRARGREQIMQVHGDYLEKLFPLNARYGGLISVGDTPTCSVAGDFGPADEIRPGNFVYYDLMQVQIGACGREDIGVVMACPVVGVNADRQEVVVHGGAVHFAKDNLNEGGITHFGKAIGRAGSRGARTLDGLLLKSLSQEHGMVSAPSDVLSQIQPGDWLLFHPVHSCLTADIMGRVLTLEGKAIEMMPRP
ncbi:MAG: alanine racemase [Bacteroidia bacterium]|nr:alanine racemase [Bacteroidia bacterium]